MRPCRLRLVGLCLLLAKVRNAKLLLYFGKFPINPNFGLETDYILGKPVNKHFERYIVRVEIL